MAWYQYGNYFKQATGVEFNKDYDPGAKAPYPGIYRCMGCNTEVAISSGHTLPPQSHHTHAAPQQGTIRWRLIIYANPNPDDSTLVIR